jgi:hypothetical protein
MQNPAARCPYCATPLKLEPTFRERLGLAPQPVGCPVCLHNVDPRQARSMGASYTHWSSHFVAQLASLVKSLPILSHETIRHLFGSPPPESMRTFERLDTLAAACLQHNTPILTEMAKGRHASLDAAHLLDTEHTPALVAVLGTSPAESGSKERELLIGRSGNSQFIIYIHPSRAAGAELHVKRAIHAVQALLH